VELVDRKVQPLREYLDHVARPPHRRPFLSFFRRHAPPSSSAA
jgi:hypothetical protein